MIFKDVIKNIRANESLGDLYTEKELLTSHNLTIKQLNEWSVSSFCFKSISGYDIHSFTFDFSNKEIITIHIILDFITKFIEDNVHKSVKESDLNNYNVKLEQLIKECVYYEVLEVNENRIMVLTFKGFGVLGVILEKE